MPTFNEANHRQKPGRERFGWTGIPKDYYEIEAGKSADRRKVNEAEIAEAHARMDAQVDARFVREQRRMS